MSYLVPEELSKPVMSLTEKYRHAMKDLLGESVKVKILIVPSADVDTEYIKQLVCDSFNAQWSDISHRFRGKENVANARQAYVYLCSRFSEKEPHHIMNDVNRDRTTFYKTLELVEGKMFTKAQDFFTHIKYIEEILNKENNATETTQEEIKA